jgi:Uma2 family endonuclease
VKTVVLGPRPKELEELLARRRVEGTDLFDEMWEGAYHMVPAPHPHHGIVENELAVALAGPSRAAGLIGTGPFNLGTPTDYRVPDRGYHRTVPATTFVTSCALVVEVVSPDDETFAKLAFYAAAGVEEIIVADPRTRRLTCLGLQHGKYVEQADSGLLSVNLADLQSAISWPA